MRDSKMPTTTGDDATVTSTGALDDETRALVRLAGLITAGSELEVRSTLLAIVAVCRAEWVEEVILQSYLFAGFPRALNAAREWRRVSGRAAPESDEGEQFELASQWKRDGEATCAVVYGRFYDRLRHNIRQLHPALDAWMITEGYGKVLSRPALDLRRRELCIVSSCAAARQDRQLHSHLHGALHAGASPQQVLDAIDVVADLVGPNDMKRYHQLFARVLGK
jgi:4-carboxymuconolactone decarboxylase